MILDWKAIVGILGVLLVALGATMWVPAVVGLAYGEAVWRSFAAVASGALVGGFGLWKGVQAAR